MTSSWKILNLKGNKIKLIYEDLYFKSLKMKMNVCMFVSSIDVAINQTF